MHMKLDDFEQLHKILLPFLTKAVSVTSLVSLLNIISFLLKVEWKEVYVLPAHSLTVQQIEFSHGDAYVR